MMNFDEQEGEKSAAAPSASLASDGTEGMGCCVLDTFRYTPCGTQARLDRHITKGNRNRNIESLV